MSAFSLFQSLFKTLAGFVVHILVFLLKAWKLGISPYFGNRCRFHPSCSEYGMEALKRHGLLRGGMLTVYRLLRCQPFAEGGVDEVPVSQLVSGTLREETNS